MGKGRIKLLAVSNEGDYKYTRVVLFNTRGEFILYAVALVWEEETASCRKQMLLVDTFCLFLVNSLEVSRGYFLMNE